MANVYSNNFWIDIQAQYDVNAQGLKEVASEAEKMWEQVTKFEIIKGGKDSNIKAARDVFQQLYKDLDKYQKEYATAAKSSNKEVAESFRKDIETTLQQIQKLQSVAGNIDLIGNRNGMAELISGTSIRNVMYGFNATPVNEFANAVQRARTVLSTFRDTQVNTVTSSQNLAKGVSTTTQQLNSFNKAVQTSSSTKASDTFNKTRDSLIKYSSALTNSTEKVNFHKQAVNEMTKATQEQNQELQKSTGFFSQFASGLKQAAGTGFAFQLGMQAANAVLNLLRQGIQETVQTIDSLNASMTDVQMVSGETNKEIYQTFGEYNELAQELSVSTKNIADGASEFIRQGKTHAETMDLIKASTVQATLAQMEASDSTEKLTSTLNGYKMEASDAMRVVDALVAVDFAAATSVNELATALQKTANTARVSGVDFEKLVGYIAAVSEATRSAPELIGRAFRTMFARMENVKAGKAFDEEGNAINDVEKVLEGFNIKLRKSNDEFRDMQDVLDDVAARWDHLTSVEKSALAVAIAGTNQREIFIALMENYEKATKYTEIALDSAGSAMERYAIYQESITAKQAELTAKFEEFAYSESFVELRKSLIDLQMAGVDILNAFSPVIKLLANFVDLCIRSIKPITDFATAVGLIGESLFTGDWSKFEKFIGKGLPSKLESAKKNVARLEKEIEELNATPLDIDDKQTSLEILQQELAEAKNEVEILETAIGDLESAEKDSTDAIKDNSSALDDNQREMAESETSTDVLVQAIRNLNDEVNRLDAEQKAVNDALDEYRKEGSLSAQTTLNLVEANSKFASALVFTKDGIVLNIEMLQQLATQSLETASAVVNSAIAMQAAWDDMNLGGGGSINQADWDDINIGGSYQQSASTKQIILDRINSLLGSYSYGTGISNYRPSSTGTSSSSSTKSEAQKAYEQALKDRQNLFKAYVDAIKRQIDKEIEAFEKEKDYWDKYYDDQIDGIKDQIEALEEQTKTEEYLLEIEKKKAELAKANAQVVRIFREGQGMVNKYAILKNSYIG